MKFVFQSFGEVFGPDTQPTEEEFQDFYAQLLFNQGNRASHGQVLLMSTVTVVRFWCRILNANQTNHQIPSGNIGITNEQGPNRLSFLTMVLFDDLSVFCLQVAWLHGRKTQKS